ncbi:protein toll-like [Phymastichus coffea]|uniref:protein toll-like n=1 Tax=Phymastichus coffea TaxID=108790 RepID=UPI00273B1668|nr:protein toll-like [Phymastichus coffea]
MNNVVALYIAGSVIIYSLTAVAAIVNDSGCSVPHHRASKGGFYVRSERADNVKIEVTCRDNHDWMKFTDVKLNCSAVGRTDFVDCTYSEGLDLLDTFHMMNVNYSSEITFKYLRSPPGRQYFQGISVAELSFFNSHLDSVPFDWLYGVSDLRTLTIHDTSLLRIPSNFFANWSRKLTRLDIMGTRLQKIARGDLADLLELQELQLFGNEIIEIEAGAFDRLSNLVSLDISKNHLHAIPSGIFRHLARLTTLQIGQNPFDELPSDLLNGIYDCHLNNFQMNTIRGSLKTLPSGFFRKLDFLKDVWLQDNRLETLPSDLFSEATQLGNLNLRDNSLRSIPLSLFADLKKLEKLDLARNQIAALPAGIFETLSHLQVLDVSYNNLTTLSADMLAGLITLSTLNASHNNLIQVDDGLCRSLGKVRVIDFSFNQLNFEATGKYTYKRENPSIFVSCHNLYNLSLSDNKATKIFTDFDLRQLNIDLRNNHLSELTVDDIDKLHPIGTIIDLRNNRISKIDLSDLPSAVARYKAWNHDLSLRSLTVMLGNNPLHCDCHLIDLIRYWKSEHKSESRQYVKLTSGDDGYESDGGMVCASPAEMENRDIFNVYPEELSCQLITNVTDDACNGTCACREYPAKKILAVDCSYRHLTQLPASLTNVHNWSIELDMSYNMLKQLPSVTSSPYLVNVSSLDLSNNNISSVTIDLFSENLVNLKLHNNSISRLDEHVIKHLMANEAMRGITLHQNPWQCDCQVRNFLTLIQLKTWIDSRDRVACAGTNKILYKMTVRDICNDAIAVIVAASVLVGFFGIVVGILAALYYKYQQEIKVWLYSKQWCLWFVTEDELDKDKQYDAFVSFSHKDEDFVEKEIVAKLEHGPRPYKLCLHYRDWLAGEWIPVQISNSVERSRRTIVVLSPNFLESVWGKMEFRAAHTQALKEGRARVIIILYGEVENLEDLDPELKAYLSLNTYIKWGDLWFWDKLRYALPHKFEPPRRRTRNAQIIEDHMTRRAANNHTGNAFVNSDLISMSKLTNDSAKLLDPRVDDRTAAS